MSFGYVLFATGREYQRLAYALALSIKIHQNVNVSLITDEPNQPSIYDKVIVIKPSKAEGRLSAYDRSFIYDLSPYDETIHIESDCLVLNDLSPWVEKLKSKDLIFARKIVHFNGSPVDYKHHPTYRSAYKLNCLPHDLRCAAFWFRKTEENQKFFDQVRLCNTNPKYPYKHMPHVGVTIDSFDVCIAMATEELQNYHTIVDHENVMSFCHAKIDLVGDGETIFNGDLYVNGYKQKDIFHYVNKSWMDESKIKILEDIYAGV
jgi:hypothetical protein